MANVLLAATATDSEVMMEPGSYRLVCLTYGGQQVDIQVRDPDISATWTLLRQNDGTPYRFDRVGESYDITFTSGFEYRLHTDRAGSVIAADRLPAELTRS